MEYDVRHVRKDLARLWRQHWSTKGPTPESIKANEDASLGQSTFVNAKNKQDAEAQIRHRFPDDEIMVIEPVRKR